MKNTEAVHRLYELGFIDDIELRQVNEYRLRNIFSLNFELRAILYSGVSLLTAGLGIIIYKNIETIGHTAILAGIALLIAACFYYAFKNSPPPGRYETRNENPFFDYVVLLGNLLSGIFIAYLQYVYSPFGTHYGLATLFPTLLFFFSAYYFDHRGVLSLAIAGLAAWLGLTVTPIGLWKTGLEYTPQLIFSGLGLGGALLAYTYLAKKENIKIHFNFTYLNFAMHLLFASCFGGLFDLGDFWLAFIVLIGLLTWYFQYIARVDKSFNFLFFSTIYGYIGLTYLGYKVLNSMNWNNDATLFLIMYFFCSPALVVYWLITYKKRLKI